MHHVKYYVTTNVKEMRVASACDFDRSAFTFVRARTLHNPFPYKDKQNNFTSNAGRWPVENGAATSCKTPGSERGLSI